MLWGLVYPHQLYWPQPAAVNARGCFLVEDPLFFRQYNFHKQKLAFHRLTMQQHGQRLEKTGVAVRYIESSELTRTEDVLKHLKQVKATRVQVVDPCDNWLQRKLTAACLQSKLQLEWLPDPHFLTPLTELHSWLGHKERWFFTEFYIRQRKRLKLLLTDDGKPLGGKWSFDADNRRKLPKQVRVPATPWEKLTPAVQRVETAVTNEFPRAWGESGLRYPTTPAAATRWLGSFMETRFAQFGDYEDALHSDHDVLFHSLLTPLLNVGLLAPSDVVEAALAHAEHVPLNALEGFLRQVTGWREFVRGIYLVAGSRQRNGNFWGHQLPMPASCYSGNTGLEPLDASIRRVLRLGYCHHIERLMVLGNFFLLAEIHPHAVYRWFMELFVDAYDWVMVPNVYGMSQFADGGLMTTKPYISGSSYLLRMGNFKPGPWCQVWDGLYWRFIHKHQAFFGGNPRMAVMVSQLRRMGSKLQTHLRIAEEFLARLHS